MALRLPAPRVQSDGSPLEMLKADTLASQRPSSVLMHAQEHRESSPLAAGMVVGVTIAAVSSWSRKLRRRAAFSLPRVPYRFQLTARLADGSSEKGRSQGGALEARVGIAEREEADSPMSQLRPVRATEVKPAPSVVREELAEERTLMVILVALAYVIWQMDKVNMSVAILPMMQEYGWEPSEEGIIQSAIFWGYAVTPIAGGFLATKLGGKRVLLGAVTLWSAATMLAPEAANISTEAFILSRVLVGIGEGIAPTAGTRIVATWMPKEERSRAIAALGSGKAIGAVLGLLAAPYVIESFGWPAMFYSFGALGIIWAAFWFVLGRDKEEWDKEQATLLMVPATAMQEEEEDEEEEIGESTPVPWQEILQTPAIWAIAVAHFCTDWGAYAMLAWTPRYLCDQLGYDLKGSSVLTLLPSVLAVGIAAFAGTTADYLLSKGMKLTQVRKLMQGLGFVLPGLCLATLGSLGDVEPGALLPEALVVGGIALAAFTLPGLFASHADLNPKYSGLVNGISSTFGALSGICSNAYAGFVLEKTGSWAEAVFLPTVTLYSIGLFVYTALYDATPVDWDAMAAQRGQEKDKKS